MELNRTVRTLSNILKSFESTESCTLSEISIRTSGAKELIEKLVEYVESKEFFGEKSDDEVRSLHFFLLLNTTLGITEELEGNADIGHAVGAVPSISEYVYLMLCTEFDLVKYLKEVVEFGPLRIVGPALDAVNANLRYLQPCDYFNVTATCLAALFARFQRTEAVPQTLYDAFQELLLKYKEDEAATDFDSRLAAGHKWLSLLRLVRHTCRIRFSKKRKTASIQFYDIKIDEPEDDETNKNKAIVEFYDRILFKCRAFADILDMNLFMAWHEAEEDGATLQSIIGIEAFKLRTLLEKCQKVHSLPAEASELVEILRSVQREPDKETPTKEEKLDKDELKDKIMKKSEFDLQFVTEAETLIREDATVLDFETTKTFVRKLCSSGIRGVKEETLKNLVGLLLRTMEFKEITSFVGEFVDCYGLSSVLYQSNVDLSPHIDDLNAVSVDDEEKTVKIFKEIIILAFSSAPQVLAVLLNEGCTEENKRCKIVDLFVNLKSVCLHCNEESSTDPPLPLLMNTVQKFFQTGFVELDVTKRHYFFQLVEELCQKNLIQANTFLHACLLRSLDVRENWQILSEILTFTKKFVKNNRESLKLNLPKIFVQLLRVIESTRWNIITFTPERLKACEEGIDVLESFRDLFPVAEYSSEMEDIFKSNNYRFSSLTRVYFMDISANFLNNSIESKLVSLIHEPLQLNVSAFVGEVEAEEATFTLRLGELLPRLTSKELQNVVTNFAGDDVTNLTFILDFISHGISFIGSCAAQYSTMPQANSNAIISCIGQMLNNFLVVLQVNWPIFLAADQKFYFVKHVKRIAAVLHQFPSHSVQPYQFNLIKFVDDSLIKLRALNAETEMTDSMLREFDQKVRQLFVGFALL